jgi:hypothetical protein
MTKQQIIREAQEWLTTPNRAVELYKRGEPTFEVDATSDASAIKCLWRVKALFCNTLQVNF